MKQLITILIALTPIIAQSAEKEAGREFAQFQVSCIMNKSKLTRKTDKLILNIDAKNKLIETSEILRQSTLTLTSISDVDGRVLAPLTTESSLGYIPSGQVM